MLFNTTERVNVRLNARRCRSQDLGQHLQKAPIALHDRRGAGVPAEKVQERIDEHGHAKHFETFFDRDGQRHFCRCNPAGFPNDPLDQFEADGSAHIYSPEARK